MTDHEREELKDLVASEGWKLVVEEATKRRNAAAEALIFCRDVSQMAHLQEKVQAFDYIVGLPHRMIKEVKNEKGNEGE